MSEVKLFAVLLLALMVGAYLTWTAEDDKATETKVTIFDGLPEQITKIELYTKTQTVAVDAKEANGEKYTWFEVDSRGRKRSFVGNEKSDDLKKKFAPFVALRSLGKGLTESELEFAKLDEPERKLVVTIQGKRRELDVGGRTTGARDHYVRSKGDAEVYLVASKVLGDLEFPEGKFMQRKLRSAENKEVDKLLLAAGDNSLTAFQKNRLSPKDAFWTREGSEDKDDTLKNFIDKLEKLTAIEYPADAQKMFDTGETILEVSWFDEDGKELGRAKLTRNGEGKKADYFAQSTATRIPAKVSRFTAEQLETSLEGLFSGQRQPQRPSTQPQKSP
jgi:hypothetical protein